MNFIRTFQTIRLTDLQLLAVIFAELLQLLILCFFSALEKTS